MSDRPAIELAEPLSKRFSRHAMDLRFYVIGLASRWLVPRDEERSFDDLKRFCCFVGHGRSGGTLVGALLNAHPNVVMSNELNALRRLRLGTSAQDLFRIIYLVSKRQVRQGSMGGGGYSYAVPNQWQGRHRRLTVIGDRKAGATAYEIIHYPSTLEVLERKVRLPKKFVHVVRNPYDAITTTYFKTAPTPGAGAGGHLTREVRNFFVRCAAVELVERKFGSDSIHFLHHERLIAEPSVQMRRVCEFLGVEAFPDYLDDCAAILNKDPHQSRRLLEWPSEQTADVMAGIRQYHWLANYDFTS